MHLIQCRLRTEALIRFARAQRLINRQNTDSDLGYAAHALLARLFGDLAPRPFRLMAGAPGARVENPENRLVTARTREIHLLGYAIHSADDLRDQAGLFALPDAHECLVVDSLASKPMPSRWPTGRRLGFEVLCCPIARRKDTEKDMFLWAVEDAGEGEVRRIDVYQRWLSHQLQDAATVESTALDAFRLARFLRRDHPGEGQKRTDKRLQRPQALFSGVLAITDGDGFGELLARGIGRHRAFGYGMLLLKPA